MTLPFQDKNNYLFDAEDKDDSCFVCKFPEEKLIVVRRVSTMMLVHICGECFMKKIDDFLLDNTRPWLGPKER